MRGAFHAEHFQNVRVRVTATDQDAAQQQNCVAEDKKYWRTMERI
jgi:hypothetical protein